MKVEQANAIKGQLVKIASLKLPLLDNHDWDDIWQSTLMDIWQHPGEWPYGFVLSRLLSRAVDFLRMESRRGFTNMPDNPEIVPLEEYLLPDSPLNTEHDVWIQELRELFNKIPAPEQRMAAVMHYIEGHTHEKVSKEMSVSVLTAKRYAYAGLAWVQQQVKGD